MPLCGRLSGRFREPRSVAVLPRIKRPYFFDRQLQVRVGEFQTYVGEFPFQGGSLEPSPSPPV